MTGGALDLTVLGRRVRHERRRADMTLGELGEKVGKPASYLSQLETGKIEPKLSVVNDLAKALDVSPSVLLDPEPPDERSRLEIELDRLQDTDGYRSLGLPPLKTSKLADDALAHLVALARQMPESRGPGGPTQRAGDRARLANTLLRDEMRERNNYYPEIEAAARRVLTAVGYAGHGPISERLLHDMVRHFGFRVERVHGMPRSARSVTDQPRTRHLHPRSG